MEARILLLTSEFPPNNATGARRPYYLARALRAHGHSVTVLTSRSIDAAWPVELDGMHVHYLDRVTWPTGMTAWRKILGAFLRFWEGSPMHRPLQALLAPLLPLFPGRHWSLTDDEMLVLAGQPDIIVATGPSWNILHMASRLSARTGAPFFTDHRDPWNVVVPDVALKCINDHGRGLLAWIRRMRNLHLERRVMGQVTGITAASPAYLENARRIAPAGVPAQVIYNGWVPRAIPHKQRNEKFTLLYTGLTYAEQNWRLLTDVLERMVDERPDVRDRMVLKVRGQEGAASALLRKCSERIGIVEVLPPIGRDELVAEAQQADLLLSVIAEGNKGQLPLKLMDYLGYGRPILLLGRTPGIQQ